MNKPNRAANLPFVVDVQAGKTYYWCACGLSQTQPFCDGSHKPTPFLPVAFTAAKDEKKFFCGCKATASAPFCDGTHSRPS